MLTTASQPDVTVSVIMAAHNTEPYVGAAIESALAQTRRDIELIVVDDLSTDRTFDTIERYAARDARVRPIRARCGSAAAARNVAIGNARGELFALLDSDDVWYPTYLERQLALLDSHPAATIVSANALTLIGDRIGKPLDSRRGLRVLAFDDLVADESAVCIMSVVHRRVFDAVGLFDETLRAEDYEFWLRATHAGFVILKNPEPLGLYRRRADSKSADLRAAVLGIVTVLERVRGWSIAPGSDAIVERQLARFRRELVTIDAKEALAAGDYDAAAALLDELARAGGGLKVALAALAARHCPAPLAWIVNRRALRSATTVARG